MKIKILSIVVLVFISACVQQQPIKEITIPGHPIYAFSYDVRESLRIKTNDPDGIRRLILGSRNISIVFNGSNETDNGSFQVVAFNTITKIQTYFVWEGGVLSVHSYYYIKEDWFGDFNGTSTQISKPVLKGPVIWLKGPNTGANETSVTLDGNIILVQGISHEDLTRAGDKLSLVVLGVERI